MKKPIIFSLLFFIISSISSFGQGVWIEENVNRSTGLRTGKIEVNGNIYEIKLLANLEGANLEGANLEGADLGGNLQGANLQGANLRGANLQGANLIRANLQGANLQAANLMLANLSGVNLSGADLSKGVRLIGANLSGTDLSGADVTSVDFRMVNLTGANLSNVQRYGLDGYNFKKIDDLEKDSRAKDDKIAALENRLAIIEAQLAEINNANVIKELVEQVAELQKRPTIEQVRDARAGSVVLTVDPEGDTVTLGLTIEQSDNLIEWTKLDGEMTRTIPIPDGKKFYRFALDK